MYYEFESGFNEYFKSTKLSSTEGILSELKATKTKLSIYRFLYFATVTLFFISIILLNKHFKYGKIYWRYYG